MCKVLNEHRTKKIKCCWYFGVIELAYENVLKLFFLPLLRWKIHHRRFLRSFLLQISFTSARRFTCGSFLYSLKHRFRLFVDFIRRTRNERENILREKLQFAQRGKRKMLMKITCSTFSLPVFSTNSHSSQADRSKNDIKDGKTSQSIELFIKIFFSSRKANLAEIKIFT
jgi:hypothetical protein